MAESRLDERLAKPKNRWYFTKEELMNSPSRAKGVDPEKELSYRQQAANMIQDMGHRLNLLVGVHVVFVACNSIFERVYLCPVRVCCF